MRTRADAIRRSMAGPWAQESVVEVQRAALRGRPGQMGPRPGRGRAGGAVPRSRFRRNPKGAWVLLGSAIVRMAKVARPRMLGSAIVRLAKVARPRMRASLALLVVDDLHRHRLPPR